MRIITWNVNSVRARLLNLENFLKENSVDILLLQELKCEEQYFPESLLDLGYNAAIYGQKTYNGVAILSKHIIEDVCKGIPGFQDKQARYIEAFTGGIRVASVYVPNGQTIESDAYQYKLEFMNHLHDHLKITLNYEEKFIIGGDFNIAPTDEDVYDPKQCSEKVLCSQKEREAFFKLQHLGFTDSVKQYFYNKEMPFTWWDYRSGSFVKNNGLRIDHLLVSPNAADQLISAKVYAQERAKEKASDHAPVECALNI